MIGLFKIFDAHAHFYSNSFFKFLIKQKPNRADINAGTSELAAKGHIEIPAKIRNSLPNGGSISWTNGSWKG